LVEKDTPIVYCNDIEELVAMVLHHRSQETNDVDIKLGVDGGQGFLKVTLSITLKPELKNNKIPEKLSKSDGYACKDFKDSSVHKTIILAILPSLNEKYHNLRLILDKLNISSLDYTVSEDLKILLQMVGKQTATSKHPCPYCMTSSPDFQKADHYTLESLCTLYDQWMADGANLKKAKKYTNVVNSPLLTGNKNKKILELVNIPGLHILLGVVDKILKEIEKNLFENKECGLQFVNQYLSKINICRVSYQGQHRLEGNACHKLLKNIDSFELFFQEFSLGVSAAKYIKVLRDFEKIVHGCFGKSLSSTYVKDLEEFSTSYRNLRATIPLKVHIIEQHVIEFINMKGGVFGMINNF
jgi:hypothetical protein